MRSKIIRVTAVFAVFGLMSGGGAYVFPAPQQSKHVSKAKVSAPSYAFPGTVPAGKSVSLSTPENSFGQMPMHFEKNQGQTDSQVQFLAKGGGYTLYLTPTEAVFTLRPPQAKTGKFLRRAKWNGRSLQAAQSQKVTVLRMKLSGGNLAPTFEGSNKLSGTVNYLIGRNPSKWHIGIPTFSTVQVSDVYPGIDMLYYGNQRQLEYDFVVKPGADPGKIAFDFEGATGVSLGQAGEVKIDSQAGRLTVRRPALYQMENGVRKAVDGNFVIRNGRTVGVDVKGYNPRKPLVVDPVLAYSTYLGGSGEDLASSIAVDSQGYAYVAGDTNSSDFPTVGTSISPAPSGNTIVFVSKLNQTGTALVYSTYLGGTSADGAMGIAVDGNGQAYVTGITSSADFPITSGNALQASLGAGATFNGFLSKLSSDGTTLLYSTYLGGGADDEAMGVAVDANQNAFLTGSATSSTFPVTTTNAFQTTLNSVNGNAFVTRIDTTQSGNGSLIYSTFLGGSSPYSISDLTSGSFGGDAALKIAVDSNENAYVTGEASSTDFPITGSTAYQTVGNAHNSVFMTRLDTTKSGANSLVYSTFLSGTGTTGDIGDGIALDSQGSVYLTGSAFSSDFPITVGSGNSAVGKAFVAKVNPNLSGTASLVYSTLIGGSSGESGDGIAVDPSGNAYIGGYTYSTDFPVTPGAIQSTLQSASSSNGFIVALSPNGSTLVYGTYFGGSGTATGDYVNDLAVDSSGNVYFAGQTDSSDIPTTAGVLQESLDGTLDAFVCKLTGIASPAIISVSTLSATVGSPVTITGTNLGEVQGAGSVAFNGAQATPTSWSASQIVVPVPTGASVGPLTVTVDGTTLTATSQFGIVPNIATVSPPFGLVGTSVTITGSGFASSMGSGSVVLGTATGTVASWNDTQIIALVAPGSVSGFIQVQQDGFISNSASFSVNAPPALTTVSPASGASGTQVTFTGSGFGAIQGNSVVLLGNRVGTVTSWSDTQVIAKVTPGAASGTAQVIQGGVGSNSFNFTVTTVAPNITGVSPSAGPAGTQVTVTGSGFGVVQGSGRLVLGTTNGVVASWNDSQIVANIAAGSSSGVVQILQPGASSNSVSFVVNTPTISNISPSEGGPGSQVTISGSGFGATQGSGNVWIGTSYASVMSWGDGQVVATVGAGAASGYAQILQNGVWSNSVPFNSNAPHIAWVSPTAGTSGAQITIYGSGFGTSTGTLQLGTLQGIISSWTESQIVATVAASSLTGIVQVQQNGMTSNSLRFVVPTSGNRNSVILTPSKLNLFVGQTQKIRALSPTGTAMTGLSWNTSDSTVVSLSPDDPPILTANAPGHAAITAGDSSCDVTVVPSGFPLPIGTVIWSAAGDDSGVSQIIPAIPSPSGVADTFAVQNSGSVQAITVDGQVAWTATLDPNYSTLNADFLGGLVETTPSTVTRFDGLTGQKHIQYTYASPANLNVASLSTDGTIFTIDGGSVVGIDPATNAVKFKVAMDHGLDFELHTCEYNSTVSNDIPPSVGTSTLAGDGNFYVVYEYSNTSYSDAPACSGDAYRHTTSQALLRVGSDGSSTKIQLGGSVVSDEVTYFSDQFGGGFIDTHSESGASVQISSMFSNADQGVIATGTSGGTNAYCSSETYHFGSGMTDLQRCVPATSGQTSVMNIGGSGPTPNSAAWTNFTPRLQALDGTFYGTMNDGSLNALDASGNVKWSVPGSSPVMLIADGSVIAESNGQYITVDQNGIVTGQIANFPILSWKGTYQLGSVDAIVSPTFTPMASPQAVGSGNFSGNGTPLTHHSFGIFWCGIGTGLQGYVSVNPNPCPQGQNGVKWGYYAVEDDNQMTPSGSPNPNYCPAPSCGFGALQDFSSGHLDRVGTVENAAFTVFQAAYAKFPIQVVLATQSGYCPLVIRCSNTTTPDQDFTVYILGDYPFNGAGQLFSDSSSVVHYFALLEGAQDAYGQSSDPNSGGGVWVKYLPTYPPQDPGKFSAMLGAMGTAIGNASAHEIGHHLERITNIKSNNFLGFPFMDCGLANHNDPNRPTPIDCENDDNFVYNFFSASGQPQYPGLYSSGAMFFYGVAGTGTVGSPLQPDIHWGPSNICWLQNYAAPANCKNP